MFIPKYINSILVICIILLNSCSTAEKQKIYKSSKTKVTPHLEATIFYDNNLLYCSTFQLAWNELMDKILNESVKLHGNPEELVYLNKKLSGTDDISEEYYVIQAGFNNNKYFQQLSKKLNDKFGRKAPGIEIVNDNKEILIYSYLLKQLRFSYEFEDITNPVKFNNKSMVKCFGINSYSKVKNTYNGGLVDVYHKDRDNFIIKIRFNDNNDELILAKIPPEKDLLSSINKSEKNMLVYYKIPDWTKGESLQIPIISFDIDHNFVNLEKRKFLNTGREEYYIREAYQMIEFKLDKKGAEIASKAKIRLRKNGGDFNKDDPLQFIFDKSFLIYLKQKNANLPYLAAWVGNDEFMEKEK